jgi:Uncharacterised nucleotidyltransferase
MTPAEGLVCAIVRGDVTSWPLPDGDSLEQLVKAAFHHNVQLILFDILKKSPAWSRWPLRLREKLENEAATATTLDLIGEQELRRVLIRLDEYGIQPLLLKGTPLAYTLYRSPTLRPRGDTDLLIRESDLQPVARILVELGYDGPDAQTDKLQTDKLTSYECLYRRKDSFGADHYLDMHWKVNNAQLFAKTFSFDELSADAIEIPALASCARGLSYTHALLLACMHRFGHAHAPFYVDGNPVYAGDHIRWVYDIHLLSATLNNARWSEFTTLARTKSIAEFCVDGLNAAKEAFNTQIPAEAMGALQTAARDEAASAQRLRASGVAWFFANLRALPDLRQRIALIKQVALPPHAYMMEKYQTKNWLALPFLYGYRSVNGVFKRIKRSK